MYVHVPLLQLLTHLAAIDTLFPITQTKTVIMPTSLPKSKFKQLKVLPQILKHIFEYRIALGNREE